MSLVRADAKKPRQRFKVVAERRTRKAIKALRLVAACLEKPWYRWTQVQANEIVKALEEELARIRAIRDGKELVTFTLMEAPSERRENFDGPDCEALPLGTR